MVSIANMCPYLHIKVDKKLTSIFKLDISYIEWAAHFDLLPVSDSEVEMSLLDSCAASTGYKYPRIEECVICAKVHLTHLRAYHDGVTSMNALY